MQSVTPRHIADLEVSALGLGCMGMTMAYGRADRAVAIQTLERAVERGVTLFDTADMYGAGANERLVGEVLRPFRDQVHIATKTGIRTVPGLGLPMGVSATPARIRRTAEASLRRLGLERLDLYYLHRVDPRVPIEDSIGAIAELVSAGKVRHVGVSEVTADELKRAHATHPIAAVQMEWSIFSRDPERDVVPAAAEIGAAVVAYSPLGRGMLTGSASATTALPLLDFRRTLPRWKRENLEANVAAVEQVRQVADEVGATAGQVALAWLLRRSDSVIPIPGTKRPTYLDENLAALDVSLTDDQVARLDTLTASGDRYGS